MTDINDFLTSIVERAENSRRDALLPVADARKDTTNKLRDVPLTSAAIPSLLTRAKLSPATRLAEERRLAALRRKKPERTAARGRRHWKRKLVNKKRRNRKDFEAAAGLGAILRSRGYKRIDQQLWDRYIGECFREYSPEYLTIKKIKRYPGRGQGAYYGNKEFPLTVYSYRVHHKLLGVVYDGNEQLKIDQTKEKPAD